MVIESVGENLKYHRKNMRLEQQELAAKTDFRLPTLSGIENGKKNPSITGYKILCDALDLPLDYALKDYDPQFVKFSIAALYLKIKDKERAKNLFDLLADLFEGAE